MEALEQRTLLSAAPVFELSDLLSINGGNGSQGVVINGVSLGDRSGVSVSSAGDVNGDGFDDVIIGAFRDGPNGVNSGASFVVFGQAGGFNASLQLSSLTGANGFKINGIAGGDFSGRSVAAAGDVNGDGFDDLLIGAFVASPNGAESGQAYVVYGKAGGFTPTLELSSLNGTNGFSIDGLSAGDRLGFSVRGAGDVNGDGVDDFILGASLDAPNGAASGTGYVVFGQVGGFGSSFDLGTLNGSNGFAINGVSADDQLGISVNAAGDVNGDGIGDVVVGAFQDDPNAAADSGAAFVVFGATSGFSASLNPSTLNGSNGFAINGETSLDNAGRSVGSAGDFNGDGFADVLIGAPAADGAVAGSGSAYVVFGHAGAFASSVNLSALTGADGFKLNGIDAGDRTGLAVSAAGDVNGDGLGDLLVAADRANPNGTRSGETYLVLGRSTAVPASLNLSALTGADGFVLNGINPQDSSGTSIRDAGDVDGDGFADFIIGAFLADPNGGESGESYLVFGGNFSDAVTHLGASLSDGLVGTGSADVMVAGRGNDSLTANGGADVLIAGQGDDEIFITDSAFNRIDGGSGSDTLTLNGGGLTLDLTAVTDGRITGIEKIDISSGANTLTLELRDVLNLSDTSNTLTVVRNLNGTVNIGAGWTQTGSQVVNGNQETTFTQGNATLILVVLADLIDPVVTVGPLLTETRSPQLTGTVADLDPATTVSVTVDGTAYAATNNGDGTWTLPAGTISPDLADGVYEVLAVGTDTAGNNGNDQTSNELTIDNSAPIMTVDTLASSNTSPQLTGTVSDVDPNITISVNVNDTDYAATNNGDGTWTLPASTIDPVLAEGVYEVVVTGTDTLGHIGTDGSTGELMIDTTAPTVSINPPGTADNSSPELTGGVIDADTSAAIEVTVNGTPFTAINNGNDTWTLPAGTITPALPEGTYVIGVTVTDAAGNVGALTPTVNLDIDTPPVVTVATLTTSDQRPQLTGTVIDSDATATVTVTVNGIAYVANNNGNGTWTLPDDTILVGDALSDGTYDVSVSATDGGGNTGNDGTTSELTIDTSAPTVAVDTLSTSDDTPGLTGTVSDNEAAIEVTVNGLTHTATNNGNGTWTLADNTITVPLAEDVYDVTVTATNLAEVPAVGTDTTTDELSIDQTGPTVTFAGLTTGDTTPELTGTVIDADTEASISVVITGTGGAGGGGAFTAVNNGDGTWSLPGNLIDPALAIGDYDVLVTVVDAAGNLGNVTELASLHVIDAPFTITVDPLTTNDPSPQLTGTIDGIFADVTVTVTVNGVPYLATNNNNGTWTLADNTITPALAVGVYDVLASGTDLTPFTIDDDTSGELTIEAPFTMTVDPLTTNDPTPELTGTIDGNFTDVTVLVTVNGTPYVAINNNDGTWTLPDNTITPTLADGVYDVQVSGTDLTPFMIDDTTSDELMIDTTAPIVTATPLSTTDTSPQLTGTVDDPTATINVTVNGVLYAATNNGDGTWTLANNTISPPLPVGTYDVQVAGTDGVGNVGIDVAVDELLITVPTASTIDLDSLLAANGGDGSEGVIFNGVAGGDLAGNSASSAGDINGDGFDDLVIGATGADPIGSNAGAVYVVFGKANGFPAEFDLSTLDGTNGFRVDALNSGDDLGVSVASAGDVNGDGVDDLVIGASKLDTNGFNSGAAYVIFGQTAPFAATLNLSLLDGTNGYRFDGEAIVDRAGFSVHGAGDVNGDGLDDVIVGSIAGDDGVLLDTGRAYIIYGSTAAVPAVLNAGLLTGANGFILTGPDAGGAAGFSVSTAGDINGDGIADLRIGAPTTTVGANASAGKTFVVFGQAGGFTAELNMSTLNGTNGFVIEGDAADLESGFSGSAIGDFNGDGFGDLLIGAPASNDAASAGSAYVIFGHAGAFSATISVGALDGTNGFEIQGVDLGDQTGFSVSGVGDVNGDGFDDLVIGAHMAGGGGFQQGETYLLFGRGGLFAATLDLATVPGNGGMVINGISVLDHAGRYVSGAGDVNGDGYDDLLVAARDGDVGGSNDVGETYLIFGRDFTGTVTQAGGSTGETLTGSVGRDTIIAGAGNDELVGNGGPDVLSAGQGDDTLAISDTAFVRLAGGSGFDTLRLDGAGVSLDLTAISDLALSGLEQIDVRGTGANSLTVDVREVLNLSDSSNTLLVLADADDTVDMGPGWTTSGSELIDGKTFDVFTQGQATLKLFTESGLEGDLDGDGFVGITDLNIILGVWNQNIPPADPRADPSGDNFVGIEDLNVVLGNWNAGTPPVAQAIATSPAAEPVADTPQTQLQAQAPVQATSPVVTADSVTEKISLLDEVPPTDQKPGRAMQVADRAQAAAAWSWLHDGNRGLRMAFGAGDEDGRASESALDMATPLPEQSAISRLL